MSLASLPRLLRSEPALTQAIGSASGLVAVPESARAISVAALAQLSERRPLVVACPTGTDAGQLYDDLVQYMPAGEVVLFPAWETLPFERVSPSIETMGRRSRTLWRLHLAATDQPGGPRVIVAAGRSLVQRLGPHAAEAAPIVVAAGDQLDPTDLVDELVHLGYRREYQVEHRGEVAVRGSIVDVFPSTADAPVRIDLWGDEVDRLSEFSVADQRSTVEIDQVEIFACRELRPTDDVNAVKGGGGISSIGIDGWR